MRPLNALDLLRAWEQGLDESLPSRALILLAAASPGTGPRDLAGLSAGRRDGLLIDLRRALFGDRLTCVATCPRCAQQVEFEVLTGALRLPDAEGGCLEVEHEGYQVRCRLPDADALAALAGTDCEAGRDQLVRTCVLSISHGGEPIEADALPDSLIAVVGERIEAADPQVRIDLAITCGACEHAWQAPFDIVSYLWTELDRWARGTLRNVLILARHTGWSECEILAMSARKRQLYLDLVDAS